MFISFSQLSHSELFRVIEKHSSKIKLNRSVNLQVKSKQLLNIIDNFVNMFWNILNLLKESLQRMLFPAPAINLIFLIVYSARTD